MALDPHVTFLVFNNMVLLSANLTTVFSVIRQPFMQRQGQDKTPRPLPWGFVLAQDRYGEPSYSVLSGTIDTAASSLPWV